ncbi:MAG TPA: hypothetical protein VEF76_13165 [Patescibacteria group bacterium]|nr:hypothetical protein [Patescibacteria group bacterium]
MTLHAIAGSHETAEFGRVKKDIEFRATGAEKFNLAAAPRQPTNKGPSM